MLFGFQPTWTRTESRVTDKWSRGGHGPGYAGESRLRGRVSRAPSRGLANKKGEKYKIKQERCVVCRSETVASGIHRRGADANSGRLGSTRHSRTTSPRIFHELPAAPGVLPRKARRTGGPDPGLLYIFTGAVRLIGCAGLYSSSRAARTIDAEEGRLRQCLRTLGWPCCSRWWPCFSASGRPSGQDNSYSVSSFHHESFGPDGIVMGRSGYKDSTGKSRFTHYQVGKDGKRKFIRDDPEGDIESRSLLPDPSKVGFSFPGGFPGFPDPHIEFFKALGFPKSAFFPSFPQDLLPHDLLPPSVASGSGSYGQGVEGRKGSTNNNFPSSARARPSY
ncbi:hypothetical protein MRX96_038164 [Rhipicephalus microplus]